MSTMDILVTIRALLTDIFEFVAVVFLVAHKTRGGHMGPFQRKCALIVLFNRILGRGEAFHSVA